MASLKGRRNWISPAALESSSCDSELMVLRNAASLAEPGFFDTVMQ